MNYINELFSKYEIRKSKKEKTEFIEWVKNIAIKNKWDVEVEKGLFGSRNVVIGNPEESDIVYTAHYDTCARLFFPNFVTPKNIFLYIVYQLILTAVIVLPAIIVGIFFGIIFPNNIQLAMDIGYLALFIMCYLLIAGPANKHTANDNTSGVATILNLMDKFDSSKDKVAFILFDLEEAGLIGSTSYSIKHKNVTASTLLVNFDCVSDGSTMLFVLNKNTSYLLDEFKKAYESNNDITTDVVYKGVFYPSDQASFKKGIGVCSMKHNKYFKSGYIDRIHTIKDTVFKKENIEFLVDGSYKLYKNITK